MKPHILLALIFFLYSSIVQAQNCDNYFCVITKVKNALKSKNYQIALDNLESADGYLDKDLLEIRNLRRAVFEAIEAEKDEAKKQKERAEKSLLRVDSLRRVADSEKLKTQKTLKELEKVLKDLENANINQVRLLLLDAERSQKELKFDAAVEKLKIAQLLRAIPDSVNLAFHVLAQRLIENAKRNIITIDYPAAIANLQLAEQLKILPEQVEHVYQLVQKELEEQVLSDLLRTDYFAALENNNLLSISKKAKNVVVANYFEIAFCFLETGNIDQAQTIIEKIALVKNPSHQFSAFTDITPLSAQNKRRKLLEICFKLDSAELHRCEGKYFPSLVQVKKNTTTELQPESFYIAPHELTFYEYDLFCAATMHRRPNDNGWGRGPRPVIDISWYDAIEYCNWRSKREELISAYNITTTTADTIKKKWTIEVNQQANGYRLPDEEEWEYAASNAHKKTQYSWGETPPVHFKSGNVADSSVITRFPKWEIFSKYKDGFIFTAPVGSFNPNEMQLYDLTGNVWEWCWSKPNESMAFNKKEDKSKDNQIVRGCSWSNSPSDCLLKNRQAFDPNTQNFNVGFRLTKNL